MHAHFDSPPVFATPCSTFCAIPLCLQAANLPCTAQAARVLGHLVWHGDVQASEMAQGALQLSSQDPHPTVRKVKANANSYEHSSCGSIGPGNGPSLE